MVVEGVSAPELLGPSARGQEEDRAARPLAWLAERLRHSKKRRNSSSVIVGDMSSAIGLAAWAWGAVVHVRREYGVLVFACRIAPLEQGDHVRGSGRLGQGQLVR